MGSNDRRRLREVKVSAAYCETRAANCERLAAEHPDAHAQQALLKIADEWRRWARDGMLRKIIL